MAKITYKRPRQEELLTAMKLIRNSYNDLQKKTNRPTYDKKITEVPPSFLHLYDSDFKGCWAAYNGKRMVGFGLALMRGKQWYLADLFVDPKSQVKGIGRELLKRCMKYGAGKADSYSLCTFPYNETALALYSSSNIMPLYPILVMEKKIKKTYRVRPTGLKAIEEASNKSILRINRLEKKIRGYPRLADLRFYAKSPDCKILNFYNKSRWVGFSIIINNYFIGPAGSPYPKYIPDILSESIRQAVLSKSKKIIINIGGTNSAAFQRLKSHGFRIFEMSVLLSTKAYSDLSRYLPADLSLY